MCLTPEESCSFFFYVICMCINHMWIRFIFPATLFQEWFIFGENSAQLHLLIFTSFSVGSFLSLGMPAGKNKKMESTFIYFPFSVMRVMLQIYRKQTKAIISKQGEKNGFNMSTVTNHYAYEYCWWINVCDMFIHSNNWATVISSVKILC